MRRSRLLFDPQPWPIYIAWKGEKIDFAGGVKLESEMEADRHSEIQGTDNEEITDSNLLLS